MFTLKFGFFPPKGPTVGEETMGYSPHISWSRGGPRVCRRGQVRPSLLGISCLSEQSQTSVIKLGPPLTEQWTISPHRSLPWHLKPLGRGTPIFPCLCVSCHTKGGPVPWSCCPLWCQQRQPGVKINLCSPSHEGGLRHRRSTDKTYFVYLTSEMYWISGPNVQNHELKRPLKRSKRKLKLNIGRL